jgi:non-specific serine/threonine protein kinase
MGMGACLADDMGLGKTVQVIALLLLDRKHRAKGEGSTSLLVLPASLVGNWKAELERFAPSLRVLIAHPSVFDRDLLKADLDAIEPRLADVDVVLTTYATVYRSPWIAAKRWNLLVLDEAQAIKNPGARQTKTVKALKSRARLALTGTPIENRLSDLWSLFDYLSPGLLGTTAAFKRFTKESGSYEPLRRLVRPYILRRLKSDRAVISDLPDKTEVRAWCSLTREQAKLYQASIEELDAALKSADEDIQRRGVVLAFLMRFKQICNHPSQWLGDGVYDPTASGKFARLKEVCESIAGRQEKMLVFTQFKELTAPLAAWLEKCLGTPGLVLHGSTEVKRRAGLVDTFQRDPSVGFFVLSLKAGGTGLNLTAARHVVHFDRWWNPAVENQATDRAWRIGQKRNVLVHKFVCRGTVEERIDALITEKQALAREILRAPDKGGEHILTEMSDADILRMVHLDLASALDEE